MKTKLIIAFSLLITSLAWARWASIKTSELLKTTDLIVVAQLSDVHEQTKGETEYSSGTLTVSEVIRGSAKEGQKLQLLWENGVHIACPRLSYKGMTGKDWIWLLTVSTNETVRADYPGRVLALERRVELDKLLQK